MVPEINIWGWENEPKHLRRHLTAGRIFCFEFDQGIYCFGRIMTKALVGHIAEIFDYTSPLPDLTDEILKNANRLDVLILDTVNLFERNTKKNWRVIGDQRDYVPADVGGINYRLGSALRKTDFFGKVTDISEREAEQLPEFIPLGENEIKQALALKIGRNFTPDGKPMKKKSGVEIWGWEKKPRTMLRYLDAGMIFCFKFDENKYCFGRLMTDFLVGHIAEFFYRASPLPEITAEDITDSERAAVEIIDSYSLFDRKSEGDWRIIGACHNYIPTDVGNIIYYYGLGSGTRLIDFFEHQTKISVDEAKRYPPLSPHGDYQIKMNIAEIIK